MIFYISHSIRGFAGKNATASQMKANCDIIKAIAKQLRETIPIVDFYVPAESEPFVHRAYQRHYITEKQILDIDCQIIEDICDAVIVFVPEGDTLQGGRKIEYDFAIRNKIPVYIFSKTEQAIEWITHFILRS